MAAFFESSGTMRGTPLGRGAAFMRSSIGHQPSASVISAPPTLAPTIDGRDLVLS
jgi:hypothetical protein